jgi:hypothetical protein
VRVPGRVVHVALLIQHKTRMRHIVAPVAQPYLSTLSHKRHDFPKELLNVKSLFLFSLQILSNTVLNLRRI